MSNRKSSAKILDQASLAASATVASSEFDVYAVDEVFVAVIATSGGATDDIMAVPVGLFNNEEWIPFPEPNVTDSGGAVAPGAVAPYTNNLGPNLLTFSARDIAFTSSSAAITGASQRIYCGGIIKTFGVTKLRVIVQNTGPNTVTNIKVFVGAGGM